MMKTNILIIAFTLAGLAGMAQTNQPLPPDAQPLTALTYLSPSDSTVWLYNERSSLAINVGVWADVQELFNQKWSNAQIDSAITANLAGYVPTSRTINGKALTGNITLNADDVGASQPGDNVSDFTNDAGYITAGDIPADAVTSVNGMTGAVVIAKADIGLGNVDNTSDANKPVSTATQNALDGKEDKTNKVTSLSTPNNTTYPTTEAVKNAIDAIEPPDVTGSNGIQVVAGEVSPVYGTTAGTVAQGNDSRINNGQTAFGWGDYRDYGLGVSGGAGVWGQRTDFTSALSSSSRFFGVDGSFFGITNTQRPQGILYRGATEDRWSWIGVTDQGPIRVYAVNSSNDTSPVQLWHDGNFTPSDYILTSTRGVANGVASLDGSGKVPSSQLPTGGMQYQGTWNASTNTPTLSNATGTDGHFYRVTTAGTQNLGSGNITFSVGDDVIHNGSVWQRAPSGTTATNLALGTRTATTMPITNSNGTGFTIPAATTSLAGLLSATDKVKLNSALTDETDPTVPSHVKAITSGNISNWNSAFGWGDYRQYGLGGEVPVSSTDISDIDDSGLYAFPSSQQGIVFPRALVIRRGDDSYALAFSNTGSVVGFRTGDGNMYTAWHSGNFNPSDYLTTANFTWTNLSGKPSTFAPSAHSHNASDINAGTLAIARIPTGTTGSTVALGNHTHAFSAITSKPTTLSGYGITDAVPSSRTINGKALSANVTLTAGDVSAMPTTWTITAGNGLTGGGNGTANRSLAVGAGDGITVNATNVAVNSTVVRTSGNQTIGGTKTFSSPVVVANATNSNHAVTLGQVNTLVPEKPDWTQYGTGFDWQGRQFPASGYYDVGVIESLGFRYWANVLANSFVNVGDIVEVDGVFEVDMSSSTGGGPRLTVLGNQFVLPVGINYSQNIYDINIRFRYSASDLLTCVIKVQFKTTTSAMNMVIHRSSQSSFNTANNILIPLEVDTESGITSQRVRLHEVRVTKYSSKYSN